MFFTGDLFDRKNKPDTEVAAVSESDRSIRKVNLIIQLRICGIISSMLEDYVVSFG